MMDTDRSDTALDKFPKLQPKSSPDDELTISKVHISKNWKLPPRLKPGRRPQIKLKDLDEDECSTPEDETKKKKQNRDAQRAYRERRANRLQELEDTVNTLRNAMKNWKRRCMDLEAELQDARKDNSSLKHQLDMIRSNLCNDCLKDPCICHNESVTLLQDPFLQNMVKNFKPMKAVNLKKRKLSSSKLSESPAPQQHIVSVASGGCGFCSDRTTCVCKDLEVSDTEQHEIQQQQHLEESVTATLGHCSSNDKGHCKNCSDIDKSCISTESAPAPAKTTQKSTSANWEPGSCAQCQADPASKVFCKSICNSANIIAAVEVGGKKDDCSSNLAFEPGSCSQCQVDPQHKEFCEAVFSNGEQQLNADEKADTDLIPVSHAYQRIKNYMTDGNIENVHSNLSLPPMKQIASGIRIRGREVESKSVDDALRDMDKNALG
ncbi:hypothetical protein ZYGR_0Z01720 [Zygosaccharomyces rouxii]|uniref:ZYRO0G04246p n=2 Tax=Zygosaccharomyces rouxii TaxID=4956 RepID=C5DZG6_ZYGRC|nr:uncharacterized protein ZYRO0G04246g [Zygosaccharomyces rouxii]KAH9202249.1 hypothetical protein LQ764DRAFT_4811 [Zygosaccharomyces rouxii]GAV50749.1 hypothetical protein ZYGR_0Z01720 [Zygosaccharomyces rouxii]CAR29250.1 ZYRO0G04246p [Zygosaccharomyces rouxii]